MRLSKLHSLSWSTLGLATLLLGNSACELPFFGGDDPVTASCSISFDNINVCYDFRTEDREAATADCASVSGAFSLDPCSVGTAGTCVAPTFTGDDEDEIPASLQRPEQIQMGGSGYSVPMANDVCAEMGGDYRLPTNVSVANCTVITEDDLRFCIDILDVTDSAAAQTACAALDFGFGAGTYSSTGQCSLPANTRYCIGGTFPTGGDYNDAATLITNSGGTLWRTFFTPDEDDTDGVCTDIGGFTHQ